MSEHVVMSKAKFENLIFHLVKIEDKKISLIDEYFPGLSKERREFIELLERYIEKIDFLIRNNIKIGESTDNSFPFVINNCVVEVLDMETNEKFELRIVSPFNNKDFNDVSFLSPVGRTLLLKNAGEELAIDTPGGKLNYKIQHIKLPFL